MVANPNLQILNYTHNHTAYPVERIQNTAQRGWSALAFTRPLLDFHTWYR